LLLVLYNEAMRKYTLSNIKKYFDNRFNHQIVLTNSIIEDKTTTIEERLQAIEQELAALQSKNDTLNLGLISKLTRLENNFLLQNKPDRHVRQKRLLIAGFFGAFNLGDELMLESLLQYIKPSFNIDITIMLSDNYNTDLTRYAAHNFIPYPTRTYDINAIADYYDAFFIAGGALLDDAVYDSAKDKINLVTAIIDLGLRFIEFDKHCIFYGLSTPSEIQNVDYISRLNRITNNCKHFSVRDTNSLNTLKKAKVSIDNVKVVNDLVFANKTFSAIHKNTKNVKKEDEVGLIYVLNEDTLPLLTTFTKKLLKYYDDSIKLKIIPFYDYQNNDVVWANKLVSAVNNPRLSAYDHTPSNLASLIDKLRGVRGVVSMRYHGTLVANMLNKKVLCINYDAHPHYENKNEYVYSHYGFDRLMVDFSKLNKVDKNVLNLLNKSPTKKINLEKYCVKAKNELESVLKGIQLL